MHPETLNQGDFGNDIVPKGVAAKENHNYSEEFVTIINRLHFCSI